MNIPLDCTKAPRVPFFVECPEAELRIMHSLFEHAIKDIRIPG